MIITSEIMIVKIPLSQNKQYLSPWVSYVWEKPLAFDPFNCEDTDYCLVGSVDNHAQVYRKLSLYLGPLFFKLCLWPIILFRVHEYFHASWGSWCHAAPALAAESAVTSIVRQLLFCMSMLTLLVKFCISIIPSLNSWRTATISVLPWHSASPTIWLIHWDMVI